VSETESFVLVLDAAEIGRHVEGWPADALLAASAADGGAEVRRLRPAEIAEFAGGRPVVPFRPGHPCATPAAETEARLFAAAIERARAMAATTEPAAPEPSSDPFADVTDAAAPPRERPRFLIRRRRRGFEVRTVGLERFPFDMDRISIGAAAMLGARFVEQPLDRMLTFSATVSDLGPMAPMAAFLPRRWSEVPLVEGPSGAYFDVSAVILREVSRRLRRATVISLASAGLTVFLIAAAIAAALWNSPVRPGL
jgi:hypothetical protein